MYKNNIFYKTIISLIVFIGLSFVVFSCNLASPSSNISHSHYAVGNGQKHPQTNLRGPIVPFSESLDAPTVFQISDGGPYRLTYFGAQVGTPTNPIRVYINPDLFEFFSETPGTKLYGQTPEYIESHFKQDLIYPYPEIDIKFVSSPEDADVQVGCGNIHYEAIAKTFPSHTLTIPTLYSQMQIFKLVMNILDISLDSSNMNYDAGILFPTTTDGHGLVIINAINTVNADASSIDPNFHPSFYSDLSMVEHIFMHELGHVFGLAHPGSEEGLLTMTDLGLTPTSHQNLRLASIMSAGLDTESYLANIITQYPLPSIYLTQYNANDMKTIQYLNW